MTDVPLQKPELLAPAGSWEALLAGLEAGADAVYLGLERWSARGRAKNFGVAEVGVAVREAHERSRKVYLAANTLLREEELPAAVEDLAEVVSQGIDALILQDLGLWAVCRELFPDLPLHASTQLSVHNAAGVRQLGRMGFSRVVLARECTLPEIAAIRREADLPLEVFVHGALCYSLSGQCSASAALTGRSANRGWCAQPCRWGWRRSAEGAESYPLSPSDLNLLPHLPELLRCGVAALKIEGRLKGADYVHAVVRAYRKVLDAPAKDREGAVGAAREILERAAGRPETAGYAHHPRPKTVLQEGGRPAVGRAVGRVARWKEGTVTLAVDERLQPGDRIRLQGEGAGGGAGVALVLRKFRSEKTKGGTRLFVPCEREVQRGDTVYLLRDALGEEREQAWARQARALPRDGVLPLDLELSLVGQELRVAARCGPVAASVNPTVETYPAEKHPLHVGTLRKHLGRLGATPYRLEGLVVRDALPPVVIPPSQLKQVRDRVVAAVDEARRAFVAACVERARALTPERPLAPGGGNHLWLRVELPRTMQDAAARPFHCLIVAMTRDCLRRRDRLVQDLKGRDRIAWELPPWIAEGDLPLYRDRLAVLAREGFRDLVVTNLGHLDLAAELPFQLHAGRELNVLNRWAAGALGRLGARSFVPAPESDGANLRAMAERGWPLRPLVYSYGNLPLFLTRLDPGVVWPEGEARLGRDGASLWWAPAPRPLGQEWARVYASQPLCWSHRLEELESLGVGDFLFDFEGRPYGPEELAVVLKKHKTRRPLRHTTEMNYARGLP